MSKVSRDKKKENKKGNNSKDTPHNTKKESLGPNTDR